MALSLPDSWVDAAASAVLTERGTEAWTLQCVMHPRDHQVIGVETLLRKPGLLLADQVGAGKSKQVVDTQQILFQAGQVTMVLVLGPAAALPVWADEDPAIGEVARHGWPSVKNSIHVYTTATCPLKTREGSSARETALWYELLRRDRPPQLDWLVSNYEFVREGTPHRKDLPATGRLLPLLKVLAQRKFNLVCDEAWALKNPHTESWKAVNYIRNLPSCGRVILLNGTPVADTPLDLYAQMKLLDPRIFSQSYSHFKTYHTGLPSWPPDKRKFAQWNANPQWFHLDELRATCAPYVLRRLTRDCWDLPPILEPVIVAAPLSADEWDAYKQMRDQLIVELESGDASVARQAIVKVLRLNQIASGFLGGVEMNGVVQSVREIGRTKLDAVRDYLQTQGHPQRVLIWAHFRAEIERAHRVLAEDGWNTHKLYGSQPPAERSAAVDALSPFKDVDHKTAVIGNAAAGGAALNLAGAPLAVYMSYDRKLRVYLQSMGRIDRPGQREPIRYIYIMATGPKGQRTVDHQSIAALKEKQDLAEWMASDWARYLQGEKEGDPATTYGKKLPGQRWI